MWFVPVDCFYLHSFFFSSLPLLFSCLGEPIAAILPRLEQDSEGAGLKDLGNALRPAVVRLMRAENKTLGDAKGGLEMEVGSLRAWFKCLERGPGDGMDGNDVDDGDDDDDDDDDDDEEVDGDDGHIPNQEIKERF